MTQYRSAVYKSAQGESLMRTWYQKFKKKLAFPIEERQVTTCLGITQIIVSGPESVIPIVFLHGSMSGAPHALGELGKLPERYRIYTVDIPGQSVASAQIRPSVKNDDHAKWLKDVVSQLELDSFILMGVSWGGFAALNFACFSPKHLKGLILITPASIVNANAVTALLKITLPMIRYRLFPSIRNRDLAYRHILTTPHPYWSPFIADAMKHTIMDFSAPPLITHEQAAKITAPVYIFAADKDLSFPGHKLLMRAESLFTNLMGSHLFENSCHCPPFNSEFTKNFEQQLDLVLKKMTAMDTDLKEELFLNGRTKNKNN